MSKIIKQLAIKHNDPRMYRTTRPDAVPRGTMSNGAREWLSGTRGVAAAAAATSTVGDCKWAKKVGPRETMKRRGEEDPASRLRLGLSLVYNARARARALTYVSARTGVPDARGCHRPPSAATLCSSSRPRDETLSLMLSLADAF